MISSPEFVYTAYIKTTPEKLWEAITNPEFTKQYWGHANLSDWKKGSKWQHITDEKKVIITGEVIEISLYKLLVLSWADPRNLSDNSRVTIKIYPVGDMVCLHVVHGNLTKGSIMAAKIALGWPRVLSSMKTFLETGKALDTWLGIETDNQRLPTKSF